MNSAAICCHFDPRNRVDLPHFWQQGLRMKILSWLLLSAALITQSFTALADTKVKGYTKKDGTYVAPHNRSDKNSRKDDNWSSKGNTNPYTGKKGTKDPYAVTPKKK